MARIMRTGIFAALLFALLAWAPPAFAAAEEPAGAAVKVWTGPEAVRTALASSPTSNMARQRIEAARAAVAAEKAAFYPRLSFHSQYSQTENPMHSFGNILNQGEFHPAIDFNDPGRTDNLQQAVRLRYLLYNGGRDQAGLTASEAREEAAAQECAALKSQLSFEVVRAFNFIGQNEDLVKAYSAAVEAASGALAVARARYDAGDLLLSDLLDLEVREAQAREELIGAQHALAISRRLFLNLLGAPAGEVIIDPEAADGQTAPTVSTTLQRPELQVMASLVEAAEARLRQAHGGALPSIESYADYEVDTGLKLGGSGDSWRAGILLQYDLFDGHRTSAEIMRAQALLAEAREQKRKTELEIELEVEQARARLSEAKERLAVTEKMVAQAAESVAITRARFREGLVLSADLIAGENRLTEVLVRRRQAETARNIAIADLRRALGLPQFPGPAAESR